MRMARREPTESSDPSVYVAGGEVPLSQVTESSSQQVKQSSVQSSIPQEVIQSSSVKQSSILHEVTQSSPAKAKPNSSSPGVPYTSTANEKQGAPQEVIESSTLEVTQSSAANAASGLPLRGKKDQKDREVADHLTDQSVNEVQHGIDDVIIEDNQKFPPKDFTGFLMRHEEGSSVDLPPPKPTEHDPGPGEFRREGSTRKSKLCRKSSSLSVRTVTLPKVNCPEKIFLCVDHCAEMFSNRFQTQSANQMSAFKTLANALKQFVVTKSFMNKKHEFSLVMLNEDAQLITDFSSNYDELVYMLNDIADSPPHEESIQQTGPTFDLSNLFDVIKQQATLPRMNMKQAAKSPPPYIIRAIIIYGRSDSYPKFESGQKSFSLINQNPFFFVDAVYIHQTPNEVVDPDGTKMKQVMDIFADICALDARGSSHVHEVGTDSNIASLYNIFAKLLAHPLQRPKQGENPINYNLDPE